MYCLHLQEAKTDDVTIGRGKLRNEALRKPNITITLMKSQGNTDAENISVGKP